MMPMKRFIGVALTLPILAACTEGEADEAPSVPSAPVERGDLIIKAEATGSVEPIRRVEVKSKASGEILRLYVDVGDRVDPGALLADIDPRDVRNGFEQAEADLDVAKARLEISLAQLTRAEELIAADVITTQELETRKLDYANARAALVRAEANFELNELRLSDVTIRAPMAGTIIQRSVEEGVVIQSASQNVSGGTTLLIMANLEDMQVRTLVDETDMGEIRAEMDAIVRVEAFPDRTFSGVVEKIEPQAIVQQNVTMFPVIVRLSNREGLLRPGMNAEVEILIAEAPDVVLVPNNAVVSPQNATPATMVLGLDPDDFDFRSMLPRRGGRGGDFAGPGGEGSDGAGSRGEGGARGDNAGGNHRGGRSRARFDSLRALVESGEISQDSLRTLVRRGRRGGRDAAGAGRSQGRVALVFVIAEDGTIEPRVITVGLSDWDRSQVLSGLEGGEQVALIGAAQLQRSQQEFLERIRSRNGGPFRGSGGRGRGR
ncbi:MAG: hypothetical protein BMS9Abin29_1680 [Gemmatimonadota bacterium]|nr:MAG: hypothetical protein BMS9Abin29_1680 [Gemmatimonadota bacterium]